MVLYRRFVEQDSLLPSHGLLTSLFERWASDAWFNTIKCDWHGFLPFNGITSERI